MIIIMFYLCSAFNDLHSMPHHPDISRGPITNVGVLSEAEADNDEEEKVWAERAKEERLTACWEK